MVPSLRTLSTITALAGMCALGCNLGLEFEVMGFDSQGNPIFDTEETDADADADADSDGDSDADADADADTDVEGYYEGQVEGLIIGGWEDIECVGEAVFDIFDQRTLEGWAICESDWVDLEGEIDGLVTDGSVAGTWTITLGGWGQDEDVDINLEGEVGDGWIDLWFDESTSSVQIEGLMQGERLD